MKDIEKLEVQYTPAVITADFEAMAKKLDELLEPYEGISKDGLMSMEAKDLKRCRADVNSIINSVEDGRKAVKREYNAPLKEFEDKVKELLEPAKVKSDLMKEVLDSKEAERKELLYQGLEASYQDFAPALAPVVPFERILEPEWLNKSFGAVKATEAMQEKVERIATDWKSLQTKDGEPFYEEAEAEFFRTLDLGDALRFQQSRKEEQERINAMKADVAANTTQEETQGDTETEEETQAYIIRVTCTETELQLLLSTLKRLGIHGQWRAE